VVVATGITYDRPAIVRWLDAGHRSCPSTAVRLRHLELVPNFALRDLITARAASRGAEGLARRAACAHWVGTFEALSRHLLRFISQPSSQQEWAAANGVTLNPRVEAPEPGVPAASGVEAGERHTPAFHVLQGHDEIVWAVEAAAGRLYSASADKTIRVWDTATRRCVKVLEGHERPVLSLALSPTHLFSGSYDATVRVWCLRTLRRVAVLEGHSDAVRALALAPLHNRLYSASYDGTLRAWSADGLAAAGTLRGHSGPVRALCVCARSTRLASASYDRTVRLWDAASGAALGVLAGHEEAVRALCACGEGGRLLASGSDDRTVRLWDAATLACLALCRGHEDNVRVLAASETHLFSGSWDKTVRAWELPCAEAADAAADAAAVAAAGGKPPPGRLVAVMAGHQEAVLALAVVRGHVVSGSFDASVRFWGAADAGFPCVAKCEGHDDAVRVLASGQGEESELCFSGSYDGCIGFLRAPQPPPTAAAPAPRPRPAATPAEEEEADAELAALLRAAAGLRDA